MYKKIVEFTDLEVWNKATDVTLEIYNLTKNFPPEEKFSLTDQLKRACISVTSNIAEGFERNSYKDKIHFYNMASGSISEIKNQIIISNKLGYISSNNFEKVYSYLVQTHKLLKGLIRKSKEINSSIQNPVSII